MNITTLFKTIESTAGLNDKLALMQQNMNDTIKLIYKDTYDSSVKYGVHKFTIRTTGIKTVDNNYSEFHDLLNKLSSRTLTGNAAIDAVENLLGDFTQWDQELLTSILNRKLTNGIAKTSFYKLIGENNKPQEFEVTLAVHLEKTKNINPIDGTYFASRKCDGIRCVAFVTKDNDNISVEFKSRQGKEIETLDNVKPALKEMVKNLPNNTYVFDGEGCIVDANGDEDFQAILKEIKRKNWTIAKPCYQIFDFVTLAQFNLEEPTENFEVRYNQMLELIKNTAKPTVKILKQERINSQADFDRWEQYVAAGNWEGFMLRKDGPFEKGRVKTLLKVKKFLDDEFVVKNIEIAEMTTSEPGLGNVKYTGVKSLVIEYKGNNVYVGSGLSKEQRKEWYANPNEIIGKTITVKYFETTISQDGKESLRFPILKAVYDGTRTL